MEMGTAAASRCIGARTLFIATAGLCLLAVLPSVLCGGEGMGKQEDAVRIRRVRSGDRASLIVENHAAYDVTLMLTIEGQNVSVSRSRPETEAYGAHSQTEAVQVTATDPAHRWNWRYSYHWVKGNIRAKHDEDTLYRLPYEKGTSCRVTQGYKGRLSHRDHNRYAVDFGMREGTLVCAARDGVVVDIKESSKTGGPHKRFEEDSNYVCIAHADGTMGEYHHLKYHGVLVEVGQPVKVGDRIALSGNTGYSTIPHLHFGVYSAVDGKRIQSHPLTLTTRQGLVPEPVVGRFYTAK